jgi:glutamate 5-kinase
VLLTAADIAARTNYLNARQTLRRLIEWGVVPVVNENDTTATDEINFGDNDFLAAQVALLLDARLLVLLTNVDGLLSGDPRLQPEADLIEEVADFAQLAHLQINDRTSVFGSGGMRSKVGAAEMASEAGIPAVICNGTKGGTLLSAAAGKACGTRFAAGSGKTSSFKLWLKYAKPTRGRLVVDAGAARVLRERGSSLLPVGIAAVEGTFEPGDAIDVAADGETIGKGISEYSSRELERVIGMQSAEVRELLPHAGDEVIHRDRFVLL